MMEKKYITIDAISKIFIFKANVTVQRFVLFLLETHIKLHLVQFPIVFRSLKFWIFRSFNLECANGIIDSLPANTKIGDITEEEFDEIFLLCMEELKSKKEYANFEETLKGEDSQRSYVN